MIYKDKHAKGDAPRMPRDREEFCINCDQSWLSHSGWACPGYASAAFGSLDPKHRYLTPSMVRAGQKEESKEKRKEEVKKAEKDKDWKETYTFFAAPPKDCCPCGIAPKSCTYHAS